VEDQDTDKEKALLSLEKIDQGRHFFISATNWKNFGFL
jgi:hypothetical protein